MNSRYSDTVIQRPVNTQTLSYGDWDKEAWQDYAHSGLWARVVKCIFRNCPLDLDINIMWTLDITLLKGIIPPTHSQSVNPFFVAIQSKYLEADAIQKTFNADHSWTDVNTELQRRRCGY